MEEESYEEFDDESEESEEKVAEAAEVVCCKGLVLSSDGTPLSYLLLLKTDIDRG